MYRAWSLGELQSLLKADLLGDDVQIKRVHTDSRSLQAGDLFVALSGDNFDGHEFMQQAEQAGAVAAVVDTWQEESDLPQLLVADTRKALGLLGRLNRESFSGKLLALTGSSGKTSVKEMLASIGRVVVGESAVLATRGNLNNELGVPMTLLELAPMHQWAIVELGASHVGEISYSRALARPQVVLITNAGMAHAGEFGGPEEVVAAKGEILQQLPAGAVAVLNLDDPAYVQWSARSSAQQLLSFAKENPQADVYASDIEYQADGCYSFQLHTPAGKAQVRLTVPGEHNLCNALAATAGALALGCTLAQIVLGLAQMTVVPGRCQIHQLASGCVIDDSYNANPASMRAAMDLLAKMPGERVLLLGDMGELGQWAAEEHRALGEYANDRADALYVIGEHIQHALTTFAGPSQSFASQRDLLDFVLTKAPAHASYLVKGSRSAAMEKVVAELLTAKKGEH